MKDHEFWQIEVACNKEDAHAIEIFFVESGAIGFFELLYAEGITANLTTDTTVLYFFFERPFPANAFVPMALAVLGIEDSPFKISLTKYADYVKEFEKTFTSFALSEKIWLVPPWEKEINHIPPHCEKLILRPGLAFGTGMHQTTRLMVEFLEKNIRRSDMVFDLGTGSGILSIAALLLGAKKVIGVDIDSLAVESARENVDLNCEYHEWKFQAKFEVGDFSYKDINEKVLQAQIFIANILPNIFMQNSEPLQAYLNSAKAWALSGIPVSAKETFYQFLQGIVPQMKFSVGEKEDWLIFFKTR